MSKKQAAPQPKKLETREGLTRTTGDVVGFRDVELQGPIYGIPRAMKASDSKIETAKPSIFVIFELLEDCKVTEGSNEDAQEVTAKKGDMVGVWIKGGCRPLKMLCGYNVLMQYNGVKVLKDRPKAQDPMKVFVFDSNKKPADPGRAIPLIEDNRRESRDVVNYWLPAAKGAPVKAGSRERQPGEDEDDYDFPGMTA